MGFIAEAFSKGGFWMWPILVVQIVCWAISLERVYYLYFRASVRAEELVTMLQRTILDGDLAKAIRLAATSNTPLGRIVHHGLLKVKGEADEVQAAMDEAALRELPRVEKRTPYLAMLSNVAMLTGLLGTISGMIVSFGAVANADASEKAAKLAEGISEAMNCTAFGLVTAIPALLFYAILQGKTQTIVDEVNEGSLRVVNFVLANRHKLQNAKDA
ncbi:MotA/TolQ/ExbB proton channel family protein [Myxococcota bacterium]|jgi:biopolymer transport protein ExbB/TolQ|nr:MotA/TolQ/ExbB proton channel family protein [Myxococcota bacterium]